MRHRYPGQKQKNARPELAKENRRDDGYAKPRDGIRTYGKLKPRLRDWFVANGWNFAPHMICRPARWQRLDTVHSVALEPGQLHIDRQTRFIFKQEDKHGVTVSQPDTDTTAVRILANFKQVLLKK